MIENVNGERRKKQWIITPDKFLSTEQVRHVVEHLLARRDLAAVRANNPQAIKDYYMVRALLESGLRCFEFCDLALMDFNGHKVTVRRGKGGKPRTVVLTKATALMLNEWRSVREQRGFSTDPSTPLFPSRYGTPYTTRGVQKRIEQIFAATGLPENLSTHSTRHTYCSHLLETGKVGLGTVKENMGHSSIATTNLYSHAVAKLDGVELYETPSSHFYQKDELGGQLRGKKANDFVKTISRKANLKRP